MSDKTKLRARKPVETSQGHTKAVIYGASGVGKTWFTLDFPVPYYIDTEGGADLAHYQKKLIDVGGVYLGPEDGALDFGAIIEQMQALATERHAYKTLIIDSITKLYQTCIANEVDRLGDKDAFGASKKPAIANMRRLVNWAMRLDMNVFFVAHEVSEWGLDPKSGQRTEVGKIPDVWDKLIYELDLCLHAQRRGPARVAVVKKSRLVGFPEAETLPLTYKDFAERYGKDFIEADAKTITLATPPQISEITRLIGILKVSEGEIDKVLTKAGAENWNELTTDQAAATVAWLNKKLS